MKSHIVHSEAAKRVQIWRQMVSESSWKVPPTFQLPLHFGIDPSAPRVQEKNGVVYTKPWVVELILDLAGYTPQANLVDAVAVEPAVGDGAFLVPMALRLVQSCQRQQRPITDISMSLHAYELDETSAIAARNAVSQALIADGLSSADASALAHGWITTGDFLFDAPTLPPADFIIGNPPYIRLEDMDERIAATYRDAYSTMIGRADIYVAFFEAALRQLKPDGIVAFICADRWMRNQYGAELRRLVTRSFGVETVVEMHNADAFALDVSAYPAITVIRRAAQGPAVVASAGQTADQAGGAELARALTQIRTHADHGRLPEGLKAARVDTWFSGADPWPCISPGPLALLKRLEAEYLPLESEDTGTKVGIGVATGADDVFITTDPQLVEDSRLLPLAMAYDTTDGTFHWSGHYLVNPWTSDGLVTLSRYPRLEQYLLTHEKQLRARNVGKRSPQFWYRTIDRVNHGLTSKPKLYIADIKDRLNPVLDRGTTYPHHNLYVVHSAGWDLEVLGGLLLSDVAQFFVACYGVRMRGGWLRFQAQYLRRIRVPRPQDITPLQAEQLADAFRKRDRAAATKIALQLYRIDRDTWEDAWA